MVQDPPMKWWEIDLHKVHTLTVSLTSNVNEQIIDFTRTNYQLTTLIIITHAEYIYPYFDTLTQEILDIYF